jgi:DNA-binding winged helix-turn-helix (wHTH) protein
MLRSPCAEQQEATDENPGQDRPMVGRRPTPAGEPRLEFGRFSISLRHRQLFADGAPVKLGTRAFDLLMVLLEADGALVTKDELLRRAWPGIVVAEDNLKVQISELRRALAGDRDVIRTEIGRGYRITAAVRRADPLADRTALDDVPDLAAIAARLAAIEAKLPAAVEVLARRPGGETARFRRRRSCSQRAGRSNRPGRRGDTPPTASDERRRVLPWRSPA